MAELGVKDRKCLSRVLQNTSREGEFEVECYLSRGSFGEVYRIRRLIDSKLFALKVFQKSKRATSDSRRYEMMFRREAEVLRIMKCPQVVGYHDFCESSDAIYIMLEYCEGGDLKQYCESLKMHEKRGLLEVEVAAAMSAVLKGLRYLHSKMHIIHRDIKPGNILVRKTPGGMLTAEDICISDFGLCAMFTSPITQTSNLKCGTDCFNAPEQIRGESYDMVALFLSRALICLH
jgi:serine/threonine protein kinase